MKLLVCVLISALLAGQTHCESREAGGDSRHEDLFPQGRDASSVDIQKWIASGREASPGEYKEVCSLQRRELLVWNHICGAVIYNNVTVITAASCVDGLRTRNLRVVCGEFNLDVDDDTEQTIRIDSKIQFPTFARGPKNGSFVDDIALLELDDPLEFNDNVQPAVISNGFPFFFRRSCQVVGWGRLASGILPDVLREVLIMRITNVRCRLRWGELITDNQLCFKDFLDPDAPCSGDFGGPAKCGNTVVGIASWGPSFCGSLTFPSVFTRLSSFNDWIKENSFSD